MNDPQSLTAAGEAATENAEISCKRKGTDRRTSRRFHFPERRTGFDRRRSYLLTGRLKDSPGTLLVVLLATNALSAMDFAFTHMLLEAGAIEEGNPILASLFEQGAGGAWLFKTSVMIAVSLAIWHQRKHRAVLGVAAGAFAVYLSVIAYHLFGIFFLVP